MVTSEKSESAATPSSTRFLYRNILNLNFWNLKKTFSRYFEIKQKQKFHIDLGFRTLNRTCKESTLAERSCR